MWLGLHSKFCKGSVGRIYFLFFIYFFIPNILIFCKIAAQDAPHTLHNNRAFLLLEIKKQSGANDAKQYLVNGNIDDFKKKNIQKNIR